MLEKPRALSCIALLFTFSLLVISSRVIILHTNQKLMIPQFLFLFLFFNYSQICISNLDLCPGVQTHISSVSLDNSIQHSWNKISEISHLSTGSFCLSELRQSQLYPSSSSGQKPKSSMTILFRLPYISNLLENPVETFFKIFSWSYNFSLLSLPAPWSKPPLSLVCITIIAYFISLSASILILIVYSHYVS